VRPRLLRKQRLPARQAGGSRADGVGAGRGIERKHGGM